MRKRYITAFLSGMLVCSMAFAQTVNLPKVVILGKEYYYYEVKKGDSVYGVAKTFGWDPSELLRLNPNTSANMEKGSRLYYPTGRVAVQTDDGQDDLSRMAYRPISHLVKKGDTAYSIAHQYNISLDTLYAAHPSARYGVKVGEIIEIGQNPDNIASEGRYLYYNIQDGDTLLSIAERYATSVEKMLEANPGLSEKKLHKGQVVRIEVNSNEALKTTETITEERLQAVDNYKVKKDDTWTSIARKTGVSIDELHAANEDVKSLKKNEILAIPVMGDVEIEREVVTEDPRQLTSEGRQEIYDSIHKVDTHIIDNVVNVAVLLDEPNSKRDIEFSRGLLLALDELKTAPYRIKLKVIDGREEQKRVEDELDVFSPHVLFATADKNFPDYVADYANEHKVEVVNVFNVKNDLYLDNPSVVQLQPPSNYFNDQVVEYVAQRYGGRELIMIGESDGQDAIAEGISAVYSASDPAKLSVSSVSDYEFADGTDYIVYCHSTKRDEVVEVVEAIEKATREHPGSMITLMGRPSWVTLTDAIGDKVSLADIRIPSRFFYDEESSEARDFNAAFHSMFGENPAKSFPMYSVTGYDVARTFIPGVVFNGGDLNKGLPSTATLQTDIEPERVSNWGGFFNQVCYMLHFTPFGKIDKERLK